MMLAMTLPANHRANIDRYWSTIESSAEIGKGRAGGLSRLTLTDVHYQPGDAAPPRGMIGVDVRDVQGVLLGRVVARPGGPPWPIEAAWQLGEG